MARSVPQNKVRAFVGTPYGNDLTRLMIVFEPIWSNPKSYGPACGGFCLPLHAHLEHRPRATDSHHTISHFRLDHHSSRGCLGDYNPGSSDDASRRRLDRPRCSLNLSYLDRTDFKRAPQIRAFHSLSHLSDSSVLLVWRKVVYDPEDDLIHTVFGLGCHGASLLNLAYLGRADSQTGYVHAS